MGYFSNPNFVYLQSHNYTKEEMDKIIISAYKKGKKKVVNGNIKYNVSKENEKIRKNKNFREPKQSNINKSKKNTIKRWKSNNLLSKRLIKYNKGKKKKRKKKTKK
jgi:hypothetical protein